ncbi:MAG: iron ABC transporter permease, partial [Proteobacteria bacterium]
MKHYRQLQTSAGWRYASYGIALLVIAPVAVIFASWALPVIEDHWSHLFKYLLLEVLLNTLGLLLGVGILSAILGTGTAWICSQYQFFGAAFFRRALIFPFAIPAYVNSFVYVGLLDYAGPLRTFLRDKGLADGFIPEIRTLSGGIVLMALSLYPYVYVLAYNAFESQGRGLREVARSLGQGPLQIFWRLAIPFARPWIIGGVCLAGLEVLNDFGTVSVIGISTFTSAIYKVWFAFFSPETAAQLSSFLITLAFLIYAWDQYSRKRRAYTAPSSLPKITPLNRSHSILAFLCCFVLFTLAFLIPFLQV